VYIRHSNPPDKSSLRALQTSVSRYDLSIEQKTHSQPDYPLIQPIRNALNGMESILNLLN